MSNELTYGTVKLFGEKMYTGLQRDLVNAYLHAHLLERNRKLFCTILQISLFLIRPKLCHRKVIKK